MQFDRTRIVIRTRGVLEILDLALRVMGIYFGLLVPATLLIGLPLALINAWLLHWIVAEEYTTVTISRYAFLQITFVFLQSPLATLPTTALLGRLMFSLDTSWLNLLRDLGGLWRGVVWTQGIVRGGWLLVVLMVSLRPTIEFSAPELLLCCLAVYSGMLRATRPYVNEIVLLERIPIRPSSSSQVTIGRRSRALHAPNSGEMVGRWIIASAATAILGTSLWMSLWFATGLLYEDWTCGPLAVQLLLPLVLWLAATFACIIKFLNYLDLRIRREGWDVELKVRTAARELEEMPTLQGLRT